MTGEVVLRARDLSKQYEVRSGAFVGTKMLNAVSGAGFELRRGETLAVV